MAAEPLARASSSLEAVERLARQAAGRRAQLLVLPECAYPAYVLGSPSHYREAGVLSSVQYVEVLASLARELSLHIVSGYVEDDGERLFNAACLIDRHGSVVGRHSKQFLWDCDHDTFTAGTRIETFETELGRIGMLVCADARMPEVVATLAAGGAQLIAVPTCWVNLGTGPDRHRNPQPEFLIEARAREFSLPFACANKAGEETDTVSFCGRSMIVRADGTVAVEALPTGEGLVVSRVVVRPPRRVWLAETRRRRLLADDPPQRGETEPARSLTVAVVPRRAFGEKMGDDGGAAYFASLRQRGVQLLVTNVQYEALAESAVRIGALHDVAVAAYPSSSRVRSLAGTCVGLVAGQAARSFASSRGLALDGAEILCVLSMALDLATLRARAVENRVFVLAASAETVAVIAPDGAVLAPGDADQPAEIIVTLDLALAADKCVAPRTDVITARYPAAYRF